MASEIRFESSLNGLVNVFIDVSNKKEGSPGDAYFEFDNCEHAKTACKRASKSWELYCVAQVPTNIEDRKCFGFAVSPKEAGRAGINTMLELIEKINYWMGDTPKRETRLIPVKEISSPDLKDRAFTVPQKDYLPKIDPFAALREMGRVLCVDPDGMPRVAAVDIEKLEEAWNIIEEPSPYAKGVHIDANTTVSTEGIFHNALSLLNRHAIIRLMADLESCPCSQERDRVFQKAKEEVYSDSPDPTRLIDELKAMGFTELAEKLETGKYDG